ncbi:hypothetical protein C8A00DRAFT_34113 [Chaetomidium leptoderma]|uniref:Uncharacterized protein n=1 Tax=Chaetomidium leptoderma TaxID=669021 RepID=A0AAN6ZV72_9PEZI|nr:hypothetical protein C8A00DRAFT_34113 [Chaetomidium leptoderma]
MRFSLATLFLAVAGSASPLKANDIFTQADIEAYEHILAMQANATAHAVDDNPLEKRCCNVWSPCCNVRTCCSSTSNCVLYCDHGDIGASGCVLGKGFRSEHPLTSFG